MARLIILLAVIGIGLIIWHKIQTSSGEQRKKTIFWSVITAILGILLILAVTGHLNIITALVAGLIAFIPRAMQLLRYLPFLNKFYQQSKQNQQNAGQQPPPRGKKTMAQDEAMEILGLKPGYSKEDVISAHRRMMQKVHPDRGGSDYLAAKINKAKDTLLG